MAKVCLCRLDAIGAVGIARCFTYGGRFNRVLHDPSVLPRDGLTKQAYMDKAVQQTTINHFHEKLLRLKVCCFLHHHPALPSMKSLQLSALSSRNV